MNSFLPAVAEQLLQDIQKTYQETSRIPDDLLVALKFVFGPCAVQALDLVDQRAVTCVTSPSGRKVFQQITRDVPSHFEGGRDTDNQVFSALLRRALRPLSEVPSDDTLHEGRRALLKHVKVMGGSGRLYTCFVSCHYCACPAFAYTVLRKNEGLLCKHILAVYLCQAMGLTQQESVSDQQMTMLLCGTTAL